MKLFLALAGFIPTLIQIITQVEIAVPISGSGPAKLNLVLDIVKTAFETSAELVSSFTWEAFAEAITTIVNKIVAALNALGVFKNGVKIQ